MIGNFKYQKNSIISFFNEYINYEKMKHKDWQKANDSKAYSVASNRWYINIYPICSFEMVKTFKYTYN